MTINIESEAWCRKAYLNYHCYGNTMNISPDEMGQITQRWESRLKSWQATVSNDENQYEFDDNEFDKYKDKGKKSAQDKIGYEHNGSDKAKQISRTTGDTAFGAGAATLGTISAIKNGGNILTNLKSITKFGKGTNGQIRADGDKVSGGGKTCAIIGACLAIATAGTYFILKKSNKEQKEACDEMQNVLANSQEALSDTQAEMEEMSAQLIDLSDQANEANEDSNDKIEEEKTEYDMYKETYEALKAKVENGEPLTDDEKALYQQVVKYMQESGEKITGLQEDATDEVGEIYADMETYQEGYDYAAETMAEVEGQTDFAASIDTTTRDQCYAVGVSQALNVIGGISSGSQLMASGPWLWALGTASIAAGVASGYAATEQFTWAGKVGDEIDLRKDTQDFNTETMDMYTEEIDAYDGFMSGVEDLTIDIPDDIDAPEDTAVPQTGENNLPDGTPDPLKKDLKEDK